MSANRPRDLAGTESELTTAQQEPEHPDLSGRRLVAKLIDWTVLGAIAYGVGMWGVATGFELTKQDRIDCVICEFEHFLNAFVLFAAPGPILFFALPELFTGQSLGKLLTGLNTKPEDAHWPTRTRRLLVRGLLSSAWISIPALSLYLSWLVGLIASSVFGVSRPWDHPGFIAIWVLLVVFAVFGPVYAVADVVWLSISRKHESMTEIITRTRVVRRSAGQAAIASE